MSILYPDLGNTSFPDSVDTFKQFLDILASDGDLVKQYQQAMQSGNMSVANQILQQIPAYSQKLLTAQDLNKMVDALIALERFYTTDIQPYTEQKQAEWQALIEEFTYAGEFSVTAQYDKNNYVKFSVNNVAYLFIAYTQPPIGTLPTNTAYWRQLTIRGVRGASGAGLTFAGEWDANASYTLQDVVNYNRALWGCIQANTSQIPNEGSTYWQLIYRGSSTIYPVTADMPTSAQDGELWFQVLS